MEGAVLVVLSSVVVEAVRQLVGDHHADAAQVSLAARLRVVEGRLQDAGREVDAVVVGVVEGVDDLRRHLPEFSVHRLVEQSVIVIKHRPRDAEHVADQSAALAGAFDPDLVDVRLPLAFARIADAHRHGVQLPKRPFFGRLAHPVQVRQLFAVLVHNERDVGSDFLFIRLAEIRLAVKPAVGKRQITLAEEVVSPCLALEPGDAADIVFKVPHRLRVLLRQHVRIAGEQPVNRIILVQTQLFRRIEAVRVPDQSFILHEPDVSAAGGADSGRVQHRRDVAEMAEELLYLGQLQPAPRLGRIVQLGHRQRVFRQILLQGQDLPRGLGRFFLRTAVKGQHSGDEVRVGLQIVPDALLFVELLAEPQRRPADGGPVDVGRKRVHRDAEVAENTANAVLAAQLRHQQRILVERFDRPDPLQRRGQSAQPRFIAPFDVRDAEAQVRDPRFVRHFAVFAADLEAVLCDLAEPVFDAEGHDRKGAIVALRGWDPVVLQPVEVLVQIVVLGNGRLLSHSGRVELHAELVEREGRRGRQTDHRRSQYSSCFFHSHLHS